MNEPIVSPWVIYLISLVTEIKIVSATVGIPLFVSSMIILFTYFFNENDDVIERCKKALKYFLPISLFLLFISIFTPSSTAITGMIVAKNITPHNLGIAKELTKDIHDALKKDVLDIIEAIKKDSI